MFVDGGVCFVVEGASAKVVEANVTADGKLTIVVYGAAVVLATVSGFNFSEVVDCAPILIRGNHHSIWFVVDGAKVAESKRHKKCIVIDGAIVPQAVYPYCSLVINRVIVGKPNSTKFAENIEC